MSTDTFNVESFYAALDSQRVAKGLTWKQVSEESGVSQPTPEPFVPRQAS